MSANKLLSILMLMLLTLSVAVPAALANPLPVDVQVDWIKIDGDEVEDGDRLAFERGEEIPVRIRLTANSDVEDAQVTVGIFGYEYTEFEGNKVIQTDLIDIQEGDTDTLEFDLMVPLRMEADEDDQDTQLQIFIADRFGAPVVYQFPLSVNGVDDEDAVIIKEAYLSPSSQVIAGRALSALVRVENIGRDDLEDGVTLIVSVPELGIQDTETLDELDADETETFEKIILRFPSDTTAGNYLVEYQVRFDNFRSQTATSLVSVVESPASHDGDDKVDDEPKTYITVPSAQVANAGGNSAVYPIVITNTGDSAKTYAVSVSGVEGFGAARVDQGGVLIVPAGESKTAFVFVDANQEATAGEKVFTATVSSDGEQKVIPLSVMISANEEDSSSSFSGLTRVLEIGLIVVIVILVLIALIVGFNKLRGNDDDDEDAKTYY